MNAHRFQWLVSILTLACFLLMAWSVPAEAQKKAKPKTQQKEPAKQTPKEQPKEVQKVDDEEIVEEEPPVAVASAVSTTLPAKFNDFLKQQVGQQTNLGMLKKFSGDYLVFEEETTTTLVPLTSVQSAKLVKDEENAPPQLEIKLISRD
jgi:hypothetical protein